MRQCFIANSTLTTISTYTVREVLAQCRPAEHYNQSIAEIGDTLGNGIKPSIFGLNYDAQAGERGNDVCNTVKYQNVCRREFFQLVADPGNKLFKWFTRKLFQYP